ncbi:MAG: MBL fold metallo-hydrolase [Chitinophagaceae bacterium]|nr:MBL fold metallo-hydrolase [Chitinophagaceae bacterium]
MKRIRKILKRAVITIVSLLIIITITIFFYMKQSKFGKLPSGARLEQLKQSPHYKNGKFVNQTVRPTITEGYSMMGLLYKTLFKKFDRAAPLDRLPSVKTNLHRLESDSNMVVWFGHSSVYMQLDGKKFLIDPVFSGSASPIPGSVKAFKGADVYKPDDMPEVDYLIISHDHYDHLDYETILALKPKVKHVICGLGAGAHFEHWGYIKDQIIEMDWYETKTIDTSYAIHTFPTHHDGGRGFKRGQSLWLSFVIESPARKIFYSGDGGYDQVFKEIGDKMGVIDFALMECGQYNVAWQSVHKLPEEVRQATIDIKAKRMLPVHHSKFRLAHHSWDEPLVKISELSEQSSYTLATPMIGEVVSLDNPGQTFTQWWVGIK